MSQRRRSRQPADEPTDGRRQRRVRPPVVEAAGRARRRRSRPGGEPADADIGSQPGTANHPAATAGGDERPGARDRPTDTLEHEHGHESDEAPAPTPATDSARADREEAPARPADHPVLRAGMYAWALLGLLAMGVAIMAAVGALRLVVVPLLLALFPAALLYPAAGWLRRRRVPAAGAALLIILGVAGVLAGVGTALAPQVAEEIPVLVDSVQAGIGELESVLDETTPFGVDAAQMREQIDQSLEQVDTDALLDMLRAGALGAAAAVAEIVTMTLLLAVALFFYLKDGDRLGRWVCSLFPDRAQADAQAVGLRAWNTIGAYFRGQLLVAVVDAIGIGLGLLLLGVTLALPLAVLVFFGGLFPIVGAVATGAVAVLVALASAGPWTALAVVGIVVAVQQLESNVLAPVVLSKATALHPLAVLTAIAAGGILLGVLGAFLAVPVAASITRGVGVLRERRRARNAELVEPTGAASS